VKLIPIRRGRIKNIFTAERAEIAEIHWEKEKAGKRFMAAKYKSFYFRIKFTDSFFPSNHLCALCALCG
jgi:hypothetical protein